MRKVKIYTDGGCDPNPGPGGWGFVIKEQHQPTKEGRGGDTDTTNNRMEITAVIAACQHFEKPTDITIYSDSKYVVNAIKSWIKRWIKEDFRPDPNTGEPTIKNKDLWEQIWHWMEFHKITPYWVRGHSGVAGNERADELATRGRLEAIGVDEFNEEPEDEPDWRHANRISINPHHCSREEFDELISYLEEKCWDHKIE